MANRIKPSRRLGARRNVLLGTDAAKRAALTRNVSAALEAQAHGVEGAAEVLAWAQDGLTRMDREAEQKGRKAA